MEIRDLYKKFEIMPQLSEHQLRVGGVGQMVAEHWKGGCDKQLVTKLCLVHDMGNVVKFDLSEEAVKTKMFGRQVNLPYWRKVQQKYWDQYGKDAHAATKRILAEAGLVEMKQYIEEEAKLYFAEAKPKELEQAAIPTIILMYADARVVPSGIVSFRERIDDLVKRYGGGKSPTWYESMFSFEKWLKSKLDFDPETITEEVVRERWEQLLSVRI